MTYTSLVAKVKEKHGLCAHDNFIKMAYQYPSWMEIDVDNRSAPKYITEENEVIIFIRMRHDIEEVDLCFTVVKKITTHETRPPTRDIHWIYYVSANSDGDPMMMKL